MPAGRGRRRWRGLRGGDGREGRHGCGLGLPAEEDRKGFGLRMGRTGCPVLSPQARLSRDNGWASPRREERERSCLRARVPGPPPSQLQTLGSGRGRGRGRGGRERGNSSRWPRQPLQAEVPGCGPSGPATHLAPLVNTPVSNNKVAGHPNPAAGSNEPAAPRARRRVCITGWGEGLAGEPRPAGTSGSV